MSTYLIYKLIQITRIIKMKLIIITIISIAVDFYSNYDVKNDQNNMPVCIHSYSGSGRNIFKIKERTALGIYNLRWNIV